MRDFITLTRTSDRGAARVRKASVDVVMLADSDATCVVLASGAELYVRERPDVVAGLLNIPLDTGHDADAIQPMREQFARRSTAT